jgi:hypothetical protein
LTSSLLHSTSYLYHKSVVLSYSEKKIAALSKEELKNWTHVGEAEQDDEDGENNAKK